MSDRSKARAIQRELGWPYQKALQFVRAYIKEALDMATEDSITGKEAILLIAREQDKTNEGAQVWSQLRPDRG